MARTSPHLRRFLVTSAIALGLPLGAHAQAPATPAPATTTSAPAGHPSHHAARHERGRHGGFVDARTLRALELTQAQREAARKLFETGREAHRDERTALREARAGLRQLVLSGNYTPERAETLSRDIAAKEATLLMARAEQGNRFVQLLTPEQRARLAEAKPRREAPVRR
ncbi:MAG: Spy/CpxP family protein refolding chaperone [Candidatus Dactylopiibacterium sp.]|nr:Spy/CpxP family protein refolding chaperone [Candidatus Dactylopiibacterium sp.]